MTMKMTMIAEATRTVISSGDDHDDAGKARNSGVAGHRRGGCQNGEEAVSG